ncbi:MAG TPA: hypothetical protein VMW58_14455 [Anaerolineae bacterium]|nr:hypothetical protein [Anaerolineae bacterium]
MKAALIILAALCITGCGHRCVRGVGSALTYEQQMQRYEAAMDRNFGYPKQRVDLEVGR